ncbi:MAG: sugar MFS transporter [Bacteroidetes bacterium]|nr:sugar MFS transporter [Bacteroidota bacterium]
MKQIITASHKNNTALSITIIGVLFFIFGFVTWLNGTLIPFLKISCELNNSQAYMVTLAFYISYFVMALPSSWVLKKTGFKGGMALGLLVMAIGSLIFLPAAYTRTYGLFLIGLFLQGTGLTILQTASNPYVIILGPLESAAKRISIMGICNKIAGVISPLILGAIVLKNIDPLKEKLLNISDSVEKNLLLNELASRVILPYIIMAIALIFLAALVKSSPLPDIDTEKEESHNNESTANKSSIFQFPHLLLGFFAIYFYVGAEVISGDTIILYGQSQGIAMEVARTFTSYTLVAMVIGYILSIALIPKFIKQDKALLFSAILGLAFSFSAIFTKGFTSVLFIALLGFANAVMWPAIWPLAINGLGKFTKTGSAILIMGIIGGATLPLLYGRLADISFIGSQQAYWILIPCYLFILFYAVKGHKIRT